MKRLPQPVCPWCGCDFREKRSNAAPICPDCDTQLRNLPVERLVEMIVYLAGYNHVTLRLLVEGQDVIRDFTTWVLPQHGWPMLQGKTTRGKKPQAGIALAPVASGKRYIA